MRYFLLRSLIPSERTHRMEIIILHLINQIGGRYFLKFAITQIIKYKLLREIENKSLWYGSEVH